MSNDPLLQPYQLKHLTLRNRIIMTSHEPAYPEDGMPKDRYRAYHVERAKGGYHVANLIKKWHGSFARTGVNWTSGNHTGEFVELCAWGPGSDSIEPWIPNTDLHDVLEQTMGLS